MISDERLEMLGDLFVKTAGRWWLETDYRIVDNPNRHSLRFSAKKPTGSHGFSYELATFGDFVKAKA